MKVLIACEESQKICKEFRKIGHEAYSCDILGCSGGAPQWHIRGDCTRILNGNCRFVTENGDEHEITGRWDLLIAHPPCTYLTIAANKYYDVKKYGEKALRRYEERERAIEFFMKFVDADCEHIAIENPVGIMSTRYRKPDQIVHPCWFGDPVQKRTCLWLKNLPMLRPTDFVKPEKTHSNGKSGGYSGSSYYAIGDDGRSLRYCDPETSKIRSKTFDGMAKAIATQWSVIDKK